MVRVTTRPWRRIRYSSIWNSRGRSSIGAVAAAGGAGDEVELEVAAGEAGLLGPGLGRAAQHRLEPGGELGVGEGLDHVVVGAGAEAADALVDGAHGGQHDRGGLHAGGAHGFQQREAVEVGEHPVEHQRVEAAGERVHQPLAAGGGGLHGVAGLAQGLGEIVLGVVVVLDDQDPPRHAPRSFMEEGRREGAPAFGARPSQSDGPVCPAPSSPGPGQEGRVTPA